MYGEPPRKNTPVMIPSASQARYATSMTTLTAHARRASWKNVSRQRKSHSTMQISVVTRMTR